MSSQIEKEKAKQEIRGFIDKYSEIEKGKRVSKYNEEMTKKDFILPLFRALGWDVENSNEVTAEERISKKRVEYGFRINGIPKFFLEAKALKADLDDPAFADQAINYAWHKSCTWAILTDFENIKLFNAEWKTTELFQNMFFSLNCQQFLERFDQLWLLSKEGFEQSLLDKEAEKWGKKSKKNPVGEQLLSDLTKWRTDLSKDILKRNMKKKLTQNELDEAIQRIIDRLIFIRNCEDRELEPITLLSTMREWDSKGRGALFEYIIKVFGHFDVEYNSKLFQHHLCDDLDIGNRVLEEIINDLYHTKDKTIKYDFSALDADVLGNVYEQYLGHILKKTAKRATLTEKHVHRKEQGIYYTPIYIVDYIVRSTLGEMLKDKEVDAEKIRVLDPACGSGSFLIKAFDVLNGHFLKNDRDYSQTQLDFETGTTFTRKVKILQNSIFGVDLDKQAVEIAQLNLLLKIAEKGHRLPLLEQNIKCGNSLIDDEEIAHDKAFKWEEKFKEIMDESGFDIIIGNPPYGALLSNDEKAFIKTTFESASGRYDSYYYFIERAIKLLSAGGFLGFITPDTWLTNYQTKKLRKLILSTCAIIKVVSLPQSVFSEANVDTCIIIVQKEPNNEIRRKNKVFVSILGKDANLGNLLRNVFESEFRAMQEDWMENKRYLFNIYQSNKILVDRIRVGCIPLGEISEICRGINPYAKSELIKRYGKIKGTKIVENRIWHSDIKKGKDYKKELVGSDIGRYWTNWKSGKWIKYGEWLSRPRNPKFFTFPHLVVQRIRNPKLKRRIIATFIDPIDEYYNNSGLTNIIMKENYSIEYILAILNSRLINWFYRQFFRDVNIKPEDLRELPIKRISITEQERFARFVDKMLVLNQDLNKIGDKRTDERTRIEEEIKKTDAKIDELVYDIYGITESEKKIIEDSLK
jgi:type I restriction-modification system DNA methylase subunit